MRLEEDSYGNIGKRPLLLPEAFNGLGKASAKAAASDNRAPFLLSAETSCFSLDGAFNLASSEAADRKRRILLSDSERSSSERPRSLNLQQKQPEYIARFKKFLFKKG